MNAVVEACRLHPDCCKEDGHGHRCGFRGGRSECTVTPCCTERSNHYMIDYCPGSGKAAPGSSHTLSDALTGSSTAAATGAESTVAVSNATTDTVSGATTGTVAGTGIGTAPPTPPADAATGTGDGTGTGTGGETTGTESALAAVTMGTESARTESVGTEGQDTTSSHESAMTSAHQSIACGMLLPLSCLNGAARQKVNSVGRIVPSVRYPDIASNCFVSMISEGYYKMIDGDISPARLISLSFVSKNAAGRVEIAQKFVVLPVFLDRKSSDDNYLDEDLFVSVHSSIKNGFITSDDPDVTKFGISEECFVHEQSRVSSEVSMNPKYGRSSPGLHSASISRMQLRVRGGSVCSAGTLCAGNGEQTDICASEVHAITPAFHPECRPAGAYDENGSWLCVAIRSCRNDLQKRVREHERRLKTAKDKLDAEKAKRERTEREKLSKASQKIPAAPVPSVVPSRPELPPPVDISQAVGNPAATMGPAVAAGFKAIAPQQFGAGAHQDKQEDFLTLTRSWRVEDEKRADRLTKEARDFTAEQSKQSTDAMLRVIAASTGNQGHYVGAPLSAPPAPAPPAPAPAPAPMADSENGKKRKKHSSKKHKNGKKKHKKEKKSRKRHNRGGSSSGSDSDSDTSGSD
jgi:hypothetical protein